MVHLSNTSGIDLNRGVEAILANVTVTELQYILAEDFEPYALYTATVIAKTGGGMSEESSDNFTTDEGGLCIFCPEMIIRYLI